MNNDIKNEFPTLSLFFEKLGDVSFSLKGNIEEEVKFNTKKINNDIYSLLKEAGAEHISYSFERNFIYDFKDNSNFKNDILLRIRRQRNLLAGEQDVILTLKKSIGDDKETKKKKEFEAILKDDSLDAITDAIVDNDLVVTFLYEKFRHEFIIPNINAKILIDVLPGIGRFVEFEGEREEIKKVCATLKLNTEDKLTQSYISLLKSYKSDKKQANEYRFSQYESFIIAENELLVAAKYFENLQRHEGCGGECHSCCSCHHCIEE